MAKFKKGDRVRVVSVDDWDVNLGVKVGDAGTVVVNVERFIGVRMDKYNEELHDCEGLCEDGHCWGFEEHHLELIENETPELFVESVSDEVREKWVMDNIDWVRNAISKSNSPEPLENWKHPYHGKPILVRDSERQEWKEDVFQTYDHNMKYPVRTKTNSYRYYKFPDQEPEVPEYTMGELMEKLGHEFKIKK